MAKAGLLQRISANTMGKRKLERHFMSKSLNPVHGFVKKIVGEKGMQEIMTCNAYFLRKAIRIPVIVIT